jgi:hypothetical protein
MNPDPIIGRVLFTDGIVRPLFRDDAGHQYVIDRDGHTPGYGMWIRPEDDEADVPLTAGASFRVGRARVLLPGGFPRPPERAHC